MANLSNAAEVRAGDGASATITIHDFSQSMRPLLPAVLGLALARATVSAINPGGLLQSDGDMLTNWTMIAKCVPFLLILIALLANKKLASKREFSASSRGPWALIAAETACVTVLCPINALFAPSSDAFAFALSMASALGTCVTFFWVVQACGTGPVHAICFVAAARIISEPFLVALTLAPAFDTVVGLAGAAGQFACLYKLRGGFCGKKGSCQPNGTPAVTASENSAAQRSSNSTASDQQKSTRTYTAAASAPDTSGADNGNSHYFGGLEQELKDRRLLSACVVSCILLSMAAGLLRAFPDGSPIMSTVPVTLAGSLLIVALFAAAIVRAPRTTPLTLLALAWGVTEILGAIALVAYTVFPDQLAYGAAIARDFNDLLHTLRQYIVIALVGIGWRNPYYYAVATYLIFLLPRAITRTALAGAAEAGLAMPAPVAALCAFLLVLAAITLLVQIIKLLQHAEPMRASQAGDVVEKILGIDQTASIADMQQATMETAAKRIGQQFALSEREVEVLALFALGHTQKRVAEELFISKSTAHAHIQHIYTKTGFHSRQDILNYIKESDEGEKKS